MPLISVSRLRFMDNQNAKKKNHANFKIMHWTFLHSFLSFHSIFLIVKNLISKDSFSLVALWEDSIATSLSHNSYFICFMSCFLLTFFPLIISLHCSPVRPQSPCLPNKPGPSPFCWLLWLLPHHEGVKVSPTHCTTIPAPSFHFLFLRQTLFLVQLIITLAFFYFQ